MMQALSVCKGGGYIHTKMSTEIYQKKVPNSKMSGNIFSLGRATSPSSYNPLHNFLLFIFNGRIIALQCCIGFCHTSTWISLRYTYAPPSSLLPPPALSHPSRLSQSPSLSSLVLQQIPTGYFTYSDVYVSTLLSQFIPPSPALTAFTCLFSVSASPVLPCR